MLNHLVRLQGFINDLCPDSVHRVIDGILALDHLQVAMRAATHGLHGHLVLAILAVLHVVLDLARQTLRLRHRHSLHHGLNAREAPVEDDLRFLLVVRHGFLDSREGVTPQLLKLLLQQDEVRLVEDVDVLGLLRSVPPGVFYRGRGHIVRGRLRRWSESFMVSRGGYLIVRILKSFVQVGIYVLTAIAAGAFLICLIRTKPDANVRHRAVTIAIFFVGDTWRALNPSDRIPFDALILIRRRSSRRSMILIHGHLQIVLVECDLGLTRVR